MSIIEARRLVKTYGHRTVVKGVDVTVRSGEIIGLLGRNGAGKTTIFQMIVGLVKPDAGTILFDGTDISRTPTHARAAAGLTYLPQENSVFLKASVLENLRLSLELLPYGRDERDRLARDLLAEFGLAPLAAQAAHSLSGGERRRLEIARALVTEPRFLLLDEPFAGIDPITVLDVQRLIRHLRHKGYGILITDHNVRDTLKITDRASIIKDGKVFASGDPESLAKDPLVRQVYLGEEFQL